MYTVFHMYFLVYKKNTAYTSVFQTPISPHPHHSKQKQKQKQNPEKQEISKKRKKKKEQITVTSPFFRKMTSVPLHHQTICISFPFRRSGDSFTCPDWFIHFQEKLKNNREVSVISTSERQKKEQIITKKTSSFFVFPSYLPLISTRDLSFCKFNLTTVSANILVSSSVFPSGTSTTYDSKTTVQILPSTPENSLVVVTDR